MRTLVIAAGVTALALFSSPATQAQSLDLYGAVQAIPDDHIVFAKKGGWHGGGKGWKHGRGHGWMPPGHAKRRYGWMPPGHAKRYYGWMPPGHAKKYRRSARYYTPAYVGFGPPPVYWRW